MRKYYQKSLATGDFFNSPPDPFYSPSLDTEIIAKSRDKAGDVLDHAYICNVNLRDNFNPDAVPEIGIYKWTEEYIIGQKWASMPRSYGQTSEFNRGDGMSSVTMSKAQVNKVIRLMEEYVANLSEYRDQLRLGVLQKMDMNPIRKGDNNAVFSIMLDLGVVGLWSAHCGMIKLNAKNADGWGDLYAGSMNLMTQMNILSRTQWKHNQIYARYLMRTFVLFCIGDLRSYAHFMSCMLNNPSLFRHKENEHMRSLAKFFWCETQGLVHDPADWTEEAAGPYQDLPELWREGGPRLREALSSYCDYHLTRRYHTRKPEGDEFDQAFDFFPAEIFALRRLAKEQGKPWPEINHPLMKLGIPDPPDSPPEITDSFLQRLLKEYAYFTEDLRGPKPPDLELLPQPIIVPATPGISVLEQALAAGDLKAVESFASASADVVCVDWKEDLECIDYFSKRVGNRLTGESEENGCILKLGDRTVEVRWNDNDSAQREILLGIAQILAPEHEFRVFKSSLSSDTQAYLLQPSHWWERMDKAHPATMQQIFQKIDKDYLKE